MFSQNSKKILGGVAGTLFVLLNIVPAVALAQNTTPPKTGGESGTGITYVCNNGKPGECTFDDVILAVKKVVDWGTGFALAFSVVVIAYAGWNYMQSGDNPGKRKEANQMLQKVAIGIALILSAYLIVTLITTQLGVKVDTVLG